MLTIYQSENATSWVCHDNEGNVLAHDPEAGYLFVNDEYDSAKYATAHESLTEIETALMALGKIKR